jgi:hypothetical protein
MSCASSKAMSRLDASAKGAGNCAGLTPRLRHVSRVIPRDAQDEGLAEEVDGVNEAGHWAPLTRRKGNVMPRGNGAERIGGDRYEIGKLHPIAAPQSRSAPACRARTSLVQGWHSEAMRNCASVEMSHVITSDPVSLMPCDMLAAARLEHNTVGCS